MATKINNDKYGCVMLTRDSSAYLALYTKFNYLCTLNRDLPVTEPFLPTFSADGRSHRSSQREVCRDWNFCHWGVWESESYPPHVVQDIEGFRWRCGVGRVGRRGRRIGVGAGLLESYLGRLGCQIHVSQVLN
jgi:hypothetical protein